MESKSSYDIAQALTEFVDDVVGVPGTLICNFSTEQTGKNTEVMKVVQHDLAITYRKGPRNDTEP